MGGGSSKSESSNSNRTRSQTTPVVHSNQQRQVAPQPRGAGVPSHAIPQHLTSNQRIAVRQTQSNVMFMHPQQPMHMQPQLPRIGSVGEAERIKNLCAVDPKTIAFDPEHSSLSFATNTLTECEMEIHCCVRVDVVPGSGVMVTPNKPRPPPRPIPVPKADHAEQAVFLDLEKACEQEKRYLKEYPKQFPVIISLRYKGEHGTQTEHTCVELLPGAKMVMQLLEVGGKVYQVEHLFGGEQATTGTVVEEGATGPGSPSGVVDGEEENLCVICLTNEKNTAVIPCRHLCLCKECAEELRQKSPKCPVCRGPIHQLVAMKQ